MSIMADYLCVLAFALIRLDNGADWMKLHYRKFVCFTINAAQGKSLKVFLKVNTCIIIIKLKREWMLCISTVSVHSINYSTRMDCLLCPLMSVSRCFLTVAGHQITRFRY